MTEEICKKPFLLFFSPEICAIKPQQRERNDSSSLRNTIRCRVWHRQRLAGGTSPASTVTQRSITHSGQRGLGQMQLLPPDLAGPAAPTRAVSSGAAARSGLTPRKTSETRWVSQVDELLARELSSRLSEKVTKLLRKKRIADDSGLGNTGKRRSIRLMPRLQQFHRVTWIPGKPWT